MIDRGNYLAVKEFLAFQADVMQRDPLTVRNDETWLKHLLQWLDDRAIKDAPDIRPVFPRYMLTVHHRQTGAPFSARFIKRVCEMARAFFGWLVQTYPKRYATITAAWIQTLQSPRLPDELRKEHQAVTLETVRKILAVPVEAGDLALQRDKAAAAFLFLSGCRATAFATLTMDCVNIAERTVKQLPTMGVKTKNRKAAITALLPIPDLLQAVGEWDAYLRAHLPPTAYWYPVVRASFGSQTLTDRRPGEKRNRNLARRIEHLFTLAGLPPMSPHKFRHGHAVYGLGQAKEVSDLKAVSQNLMHSNIGITDGIYAVLSDNELRDKIAQLGHAAGHVGEGSAPAGSDHADPGARPFSEEEIAAAVELLRQIRK